MPGDIKILSANEKHLTMMQMLLLELSAAMADHVILDSEAIVENLHKILSAPQNHLLIAKKDGNCVGLLNLSIRQTLLHPHPSGLVDELIVSETERGKGTGRKLLMAAVEVCRQIGCSEVEVSTEKKNHKARKFYQDIGFEEDAVLLEMNLKRNQEE